MGWQPDTSTWSPAESGITSFAKAFAAGLLQNYGQQRAADQMNSVIQVLPQLRSDPMSVVAPEGVSAGPFAALQGTAALNNYTMKQQAEQARGSNVSTLLNSILGEGVKSGSISPGDAVKAAAVGDYSGILDTKTDPMQNPLSKEYKVEQGRKDLENIFYKRITDLPEYKLLADVNSNIKALPALAKQDSKSADVALISTIARIRDPNSTVREGEIKINQDTQSYLDQLYGDWRGVVEGKSRLNPLAKLQMVASVVPKYDELRGSLESVKEPLLGALEAQGGRRANIPTASFAPFEMSPLAQSLVGQDAASMKAQGLPPAVIAQQLREKYSEYLK